MEDILAAIQNNQDNSVQAAGQNSQANSDSSDDSVSSIRVTNVLVPDFIIREFQRLLVNSVLPASSSVSAVTAAEWQEDTQKVIVPVYPVLDCILLKLFANHEDKGNRPISFPMVLSKCPRGQELRPLWLIPW